MIDKIWLRYNRGMGGVQEVNNMDKSSPWYIGYIVSRYCYTHDSAIRYGLFILPKDGYVYYIHRDSCPREKHLPPSEKYSIYIARTRAKERITADDLISKDYSKSIEWCLESEPTKRFGSSYGYAVTKSRHVVQLHKIDPNNKPLWLEEWDLAELFT